jgi:translocation and assembly module TamA
VACLAFVLTILLLAGLAPARAEPAAQVVAAAASDTPAAERRDRSARGDRAERRSFTVVVEGAGRAGEVIRRNLSIVRRGGDDPEASRERLARYADRAVTEAKEILATEGYYSPEVTAVVEEPEEGLRLVLRVELGEPVRVGSVDLRFAGAIETATSDPDPRSARALWTLREGEIFSNDAWEAAKRDVLRHIAATRYAGARIAASRAEVDPETRIARLSVEFDSGPIWYFDGVRVSGLRRYDRRVVRGVTEVPPGTEYSLGLLADMQTRLQALPYFGTVSVVAPIENADPTALPILVEVTEAQTQRLEMGVGFSTNFGVRGQISWDDYDLFDRALRWRNLFKADQREQLVTTRLGWPPRPGGWANDISLTARRNDISGLRTQSLVFTPAIVKIENRREQTIGIITDFSRESPDGGTPDNKLAIVPTYTFRYRGYDDLIDPRAGYEVAASIGAAAKALLSDQNFIRSYVRAVRMWSFGTRDTLAVRGEAGVVLAPSRQGIPQQFVFRAGGDQSLRGYRYQSIGVREGDAIVGGRYLAIVGVEHIHWFQPKLGGAVFYEIGDAFDDPAARDWKAGYGVGVRYRSPVGPINFDVAYGEAVKDVRFHISLGLAF